MRDWPDDITDPEDYRGLAVWACARFIPRASTRGICLQEGRRKIMTVITQGTDLEATADSIFFEAEKLAVASMLDIIQCGQPGCMSHSYPADRTDFGRHLEGDFPQELIDKVRVFAETELGMMVKFDWWSSIPSHLGETIIMSEEMTDGEVVRDIHVKPRMSLMSTGQVLIHEVIHVLSGDENGEVRITSPEELAAAEQEDATREARALLGTLIVITVVGAPDSTKTDMTKQIGILIQKAGPDAVIDARDGAIDGARRVLEVLGA
jgi:hypothetical protein